MQARLPSRINAASAVWTGTDSYVFGGDISGGGISASVVRYNAASDTATTVAQLPYGLTAFSAIWDGNSAYIFGGYDDTRDHDEILRFDPSTNQVTTMGARLPRRIEWTSAVWTGQFAYIFGGHATLNGGDRAEIVRYDPATDTIETLDATLPSPRYDTAAAWDGSNVYIFGGTTNNSQVSDQIVRFTPSTEAVSTLTTTLPAARHNMSAAYTEGRVYLFGGSSASALVDEILVFRPSHGTIALVDAQLPVRMGETAAVWDGLRGSAFLFGGTGDFPPRRGLDTILRFSPNRAPDCSSVTASPGVLLWPPDHVLSPVTLIGGTDPDGDAVTVTVTGVTQDEPLNGLGDGDVSPDAQAGGSSNIVLLRAERQGGGDGRVYRVSFTGSDGNGGTCSGLITVIVPKNMGGSTAVDSAPPSYDSFGP